MNQRAFSLVELSIVLVILGLLTGGILAGQSLIRASEIRGIVTERSQFMVATHSFQDKYFAAPGDVANASFFWAGATSGNGDGRIGYSTTGSGEEYVAWQHLANAGLINGTYTGISTSIPQSKFPKGYYRIYYKTGIYGKSGTMTSIQAFGTGPLANKALLNPQNVYSIDAKEDDGLADSGSIMGFNEEGVPGCVTNDYTVGSGTYILNSELVKCKVFFVIK